jgi:hypothetical protein
MSLIFQDFCSWVQTELLQKRIQVNVSNMQIKSVLSSFLKLSKSMNERKTNLMHLLYIFIVAVGDALHVLGVFALHQER